MHKQRCWTCKAEFRDGDPIVPIIRYVTNEKRGDYASTGPEEFVHASHLHSIPQAVRMDQKQPCQKFVGLTTTCGRPTRMKVNGKYLCHEHQDDA